MEHKSRTAIGGDAPLTFSKLWAQTDAFAGGLRDREIRAGDAVAIRLSNPRAFLIAYFGTLRNGCIPMTVPTTYSTTDTVSVLDETQGKAYVTDETPFMAILHRAEDVHLAITTDCDARMGVDLQTFLDNDGINSAGSRTGIDIVSQSDTDRGLIAYVGHEDRDPIGVAYTHATLVAAAEAGRSLLERDGTTSHLGTLSLSNPIELVSGATAAILDGGEYHPHVAWDPETVRSVLYTDSIRTFVTPAQYEVLLDADAHADDAIAVVEPTTAPLEARADGDVIRLRGRPETGVTHVRTADDVEANRLGEPLPDVETRVLEEHAEGELVISSPVTMDGYVGRPTLTDERIVTIDGTRWVRTGVTGLDGAQVDCV